MQNCAELGRIFDEVCETSKGYAKRSQKEEEKEDYNRQHNIKTPKFPRLKQGTKFYSVHCVTSWKIGKSLLRIHDSSNTFLHAATPWNYLAPIHDTSGKTQMTIRKQCKRSNWKYKSLSYTYLRLIRSWKYHFQKFTTHTRVFLHIATHLLKLFGADSWHERKNANDNSKAM